MISQSCEVMRPFLKPHSKRHLNQNAVSSQEFHCSNEKKPRLESNGKLMKKHDDTSSSSSVSTTSSIASREREVVINANRDVILKNSSSSIDMSDPLFDWMKLLVQKLPYIFGKKMNADLITVIFR